MSDKNISPLSKTITTLMVMLMVSILLLPSTAGAVDMMINMQRYAEDSVGGHLNLGTLNDTNNISNVGGVTIAIEDGSTTGRVNGTIWSENFGWIILQPEASDIVLTSGNPEDVAGVTVAVRQESINDETQIIGRLSGTAMFDSEPKDYIWFGQWDTDGDGYDEADTGVYIDGEGFFQGCAWSVSFGKFCFGNAMWEENDFVTQYTGLGGRDRYWARTSWVPNVVEFSWTTFGVAEGVAVVFIEISVPNVVLTPVTVDYTATGTAESSEDYTLPSETATIPGGSRMVNVVLNIHDEENKENDETVVLTLSNSQGAVLGTKQTHTYTIQNDDEVSISIDDATVVERDAGGEVALSFVVRLSGTSTENIRFDFATSNNNATAGSDYTSTSRNDFYLSAGETTMIISVPVIGDDTDEDVEESFTVTLSDVHGASAGDLTAVGTIIDDDGEPVLWIVEGADSAVEGSTLTMGVELVGSDEEAVSVNVDIVSDTATSGQDFTVPSGLSFTWAVGETGTKNISIPLVEDVIYEGDETFNVSLANASANAVVSTAAGSKTLTITDNDSLPVISLPLTINVQENGTALQIPVSISGVARDQITVEYHTVNDVALAGSAGEGDYESTSGTLTWSPGDTTNKMITIPIHDDSLAEGSEGFSLLIHAVNAQINQSYATIITILDNDQRNLVTEDYTAISRTNIMISMVSSGVGGLTNGITDIHLRRDQRLDMNIATGRTHLASNKILPTNDMTIRQAMELLTEESYSRTNASKVVLNSGISGQGIRITSTDDLEVRAPDGVSIFSSTDWDGTMIPLIDITTEIASEPGSYEFNRAVRLGSVNTTLVFDQPIRLSIPGTNGTVLHRANSKPWKSLEHQCEDENGTGLVFPRECYFKTSSETIIWTYHLSEFALGNISYVPRSSSSGKAKTIRQTGMKRGTHPVIQGAGVSKREFEDAYKKSQAHTKKMDQGVPAKVTSVIDRYGNEKTAGYRPGRLSQEELMAYIEGKLARKKKPRDYDKYFSAPKVEKPVKKLEAKFSILDMADVSNKNKFFEPISQMIAFGLMKTNEEHLFNPNETVGWQTILYSAIRATDKDVAPFMKLKSTDLPKLRDVEMMRNNEEGIVFYTALDEAMINKDFDKESVPTKGEVARILKKSFNFDEAGKNVFVGKRFNPAQTHMRSEFAEWFTRAYTHQQKEREEKKTVALNKDKTLLRKIKTVMYDQIYGEEKENVAIYSMGPAQELERVVLKNYFEEAPLVAATEKYWNPIDPNTTRTPIENHQTDTKSKYVATYKERKNSVPEVGKEWNPLDPNSGRKPLERENNITQEEYAKLFEEKPKDERVVQEWNPLDPNSVRKPIKKKDVITEVPDRRYPQIIRSLEKITETEGDFENYVASAPKDSVHGFDDIVGHWGEWYIQNLYLLGMISGKTDTEFVPDDYITRAELVKIAVGLSEEGVSSGLEASLFTDVDEDAWYAPFVRFAQLKGVVEGEDGKFYPDHSVDRATALKVILELAEFDYIKSRGSIPFSDVPPDDWYAKYVNFAFRRGFIDGEPGDTFRPGDIVSRAEVAKIVSMVIESKLQKMEEAVEGKGVTAF